MISLPSTLTINFLPLLYRLFPFPPSKIAIHCIQWTKKNVVKSGGNLNFLKSCVSSFQCFSSGELLSSASAVVIVVSNGKFRVYQHTWVFITQLYDIFKHGEEVAFIIFLFFCLFFCFSRF